MKASHALTLVLGISYVILMALGSLAPVNDQVAYFVTASLFWLAGMLEATACEAWRRRADPAPYWRQA